MSCRRGEQRLGGGVARGGRLNDGEGVFGLEVKGREGLTYMFFG